MSRIVPPHLCGGVPSTACFACGYQRGRLDAEGEHRERVRVAAEADRERIRGYLASLESELRRKWVEVGEGHARLALEALARRCGELQAERDAFARRFDGLPALLGALRDTGDMTHSAAIALRNLLLTDE